MPVPPTKPTPESEQNASAETANAASDLLTPEAAAATLKVTPGHLARLRVKGGGPRYVKLARRIIRYRPRDLDDYIESCVRASTSE